MEDWKMGRWEEWEEQREDMEEWKKPKKDEDHFFSLNVSS